jgi:hypothetical protein
MQARHQLAVCQTIGHMEASAERVGELVSGLQKHDCVRLYCNGIPAVRSCSTARFLEKVPTEFTARAGLTDVSRPPTPPAAPGPQPKQPGM